MSRKAAQTSRYRFTVPDSDTDVVNWIAAQENLSTSLRVLIKQSVQRDGLVDIFCKPVANPGITAGRPPKQVVTPQAEVQQGLEGEEVRKEKVAVKKPVQAATSEVDEDGFADPDAFFN